MSAADDVDKSGGRVHGAAHCTQCEWETEDYIRVYDLVLAHVKAHRHVVVAEIGLSYRYGPGKRRR